MIGTNFAPCGDSLADPVGEAPYLLHPFAPEAADDALQLGDQVTLQRLEGDSGGPEHRVLHEHEDKNREQGAALRNR